MKKEISLPPASKEADRPCVHSAGDREESYEFVLRLEVALECVEFLILFFTVTCVDSIVIVQLVLYSEGEELGMDVSVCIRSVWSGEWCSCVSRTD